MNKKEKKLDRFIGNFLGGLLRLLGVLYAMLAYILGAAAMLKGGHHELVSWYAKYGLSSEGIFWIGAAGFGIIFIISEHIYMLYNEWGRRVADEERVWLGEKEGSGVGARVMVFDGGKHIGDLIFHEGRDWQIANSTDKEELEQYNRALAIAREKCPNG